MRGVVRIDVPYAMPERLLQLGQEKSARSGDRGRGDAVPTPV